MLLGDLTYRCEFLSIWYIYQSNYNAFKDKIKEISVVSSFQFGIFIKVITTSFLLSFVLKGLRRKVEMRKKVKTDRIHIILSVFLFLKQF